MPLALIRRDPSPPSRAGDGLPTRRPGRPQKASPFLHFERTEFVTACPSLNRLDAESQPAGAPDALELEALRRELAQRDDILSIAAHELRNPLHALALHLALARALAQSGEPALVADRIQQAEQTLRRYSERVTVLLDLLAVGGEGYPLHVREVDVAAVLRGLAQTYEQEARSRAIALCVQADDPCVARLDPLALEQVVDNLLLNAFKHSAASVVTLRCRRGASHCTVEVEDNGRGIAGEDREHVFEKYAVATRRGRGTGSGLGLWIVARLVRAQGGTIRVLEAPEGGCLVELTLPIEERPAGDGAPASDADNADSTRRSRP
jgi:signal transduction histidine kinase